MILNIDKHRQSIHFEVDKSREKAVLRNCNGKILSSYKKNEKVKIELDGKRDAAGVYYVKQIIVKL